MKNRHVPRILRPSMRLYFVFLILFAVLTYFFGRDNKENLILAAVEAAIAIVLTVYTVISSKRRSKYLSSYIETVADNAGAAVRASLGSSPLPLLVFNLKSGEIVWANTQWRSIASVREHIFEVRATDVVPDFNTNWLARGGTVCPDIVSIGDKQFKVFGTIRSEDPTLGSGIEASAFTYWIDVTEYENIANKYRSSRPIVTIIAIDNYEELLRNLSEREKSSILSDIDSRISEWVNKVGGYLRKYDRDRYLYICEEKNYSVFEADRFSVLDEVQKISGAGATRASLSIGVGRGDGDISSCAASANASLEMALARGGDQAVIKTNDTFSYFGGNSPVEEKRSKVRSRVMANALVECITQSSKVYVMGHKNSDFDCIGAGAGICRIALTNKIPAHIVVVENLTAAGVLIESLKKSNEFANCFLSPNEALVQADPGTLLIVVDSSRSDDVESLPLVEYCKRVIIIDHHRRGANYIEDAVISYIEPYASSVSELVSEMLQYCVDSKDVKKTEADALLCGIVLDTKMFTMHTGSRTFDAAAYLRREGADTTDVKLLLQSDYRMAMEKYDIVRKAKIIKNQIAFCVCDNEYERVVIAQAADELLSVQGVTASFVAAKSGNVINVSGRSIGTINVQLILEQIGGGGNQSSAGAAIYDSSIPVVKEKLMHAINSYLAGNMRGDV